MDMSSILKSKICAWICFAVVIAVIVFTYKMRTEWWCFIDLFFAYMMAFCHVIALTIAKYNQFASKKLEISAAVMGVLMILSLIGEIVASRIL